MILGQRLDAVRDDGLEALENLKLTLNFIEGAGLTPPLAIVMRNSVIVSLVSTLEQTFRELFQEYLAILEEKVSRYSQLKSELRNSHSKKSIARLEKIVGDSDNAAAARAIIRNLDVCLSDQPGFQIEKDGISYNQGNFKSKQLTEMAQSMGIKNVWGMIAYSENVAEYVGQPLGDKCSGKLIELWNEVFAERDRLVHRLSTSGGWATEQIVESILLFSLVTDRLTRCLETDLNNFLGKLDP